MREVGVLEGVGDGVEWPAAHAELLAGVAHLGAGALDHPRQQDRDELLDALGRGQRRRRRPVRVIEEVCAAHHGQDPRHVGRPARHEEEAVGAREHSRPDLRHASRPRRDAPRVLEPEQTPEPQVDRVVRRLEDADVQVLALAAVGDRAQRHGGREGADVAAVVAGDPACRLEWLVVDVALRVHRPAHAEQREVDGLVVAVGAVLPEVGDRSEHDLRVHPPQHVVPDAEAVHRAWLEVLDDHVGACDEAEQGLAPLVGLEVQHDASLVGVQEQEGAGALRMRLVVGERRQLPRRIAAGSLDLDHVGAVVGKDAGAERSRAGVGEVDHAHVVERH